MKRVLLHIPLILLALMMLSPLVWLVCAAFKNSADLYTYAFLPWDHLHALTGDNFRKLWTQYPYARWVMNSMFLASAHTVISVALCSLAGFALAKQQFAGKRLLMVSMLLTMLLPGQVLLTGMYDLMYRFGWVDTYWAILLPGVVSVFGIFLFRQAMLGVPDELLQCGRMDGCSELRLWWDVALPIVRPMCGAFALMSFLGQWNGFLWPQIILQDEHRYTLPMALNNLQGLGDAQNNAGMVMAATLLSLLPVAILFFVLQRDFIAGLASGAVKG